MLLVHPQVTIGSPKFPTSRTWGGEENQPHFVSLPLIDFCHVGFACADTGEKYLGITSVVFRNAARLKLKKAHRDTTQTVHVPISM